MLNTKWTKSHNTLEPIIQGHVTLYEGCVDSCHSFMKNLQTATIQYTQDLLGIFYMDGGEEYEEEVDELKTKEMKNLEE